MDFNQLKYIIAIADEKSFSKAAEHFFLSQSALSQQVAKLEKQLGFLLFERKKNTFLVTPAGEIYINGLRKILQIQNQTMEEINDFLNKTDQTTLLGFAPGRSSSLFTKIYPTFSSKYPKHNLSIFESNSIDAERNLEKGKLNLIFTMVNPTEIANLNFNYSVIRRERMLLIIPASHPRSKPLAGNDYPITNIYDFRDERFALPAKQTKLRKYIDYLAEYSGIKLNVSYEVLNTLDICSSIGNGPLCAIVSEGFVPKEHDNISVFSLGDSCYMDYVIAYPKDHVLTEQETYFIQLCRENL